MATQWNVLTCLPVDDGSSDRVRRRDWYRVLTEFEYIDLELREFMPARWVYQRGEWGELDDRHGSDTRWLQDVCLSNIKEARREMVTGDS